MYGFADKQKAQALSGFAGTLLTNPPTANGAPPVINPPILANDLRYRRYFAVAQVLEPISSATWDEDAGLWRAGVGYVRVHQRYNPLSDQDVEVDPATRIGPWNYDSNKNVSAPDGVETEWYDTVCYNMDPCQSHSLTTDEGHPNLIYVSEDVSGDLWVLPKPDETFTVVPAAANDCIYPGTGGSIELYEFSGTGWVPSGATCTLRDSSCLIMALPGEVFWVRTSSGCNDTGPCYADAIAPHGHIRRVRMTSPIACGDHGSATILQDSTGCTGSPTTCTLEVCNHSNRPIKCAGSENIPYEDGTAYLSQTGCVWHVVPDPRATRARVTLGEPLCALTATVKAGTETYLDVCTWPETISEIDNPLNHRACDDTDVDIAWNATTCRWYVTDVSRTETDHIKTFECTDCDGLKRKYYEKTAIETCNCELKSDAPIPLTEEALVSSIWYTLDQDEQGKPVCTMHLGTTTICALDCGAAGPGPVGTLQLHNKQVLEQITEEADGIYCLPTTVFSPCDAPAQAPAKCIPIEECPPEDPVNDV